MIRSGGSEEKAKSIETTNHEQNRQQGKVPLYLPLYTLTSELDIANSLTAIFCKNQAVLRNFWSDHLKISQTFTHVVNTNELKNL